jgi:hypothetical protein
VKKHAELNLEVVEIILSAKLALRNSLLTASIWFLGTALPLNGQLYESGYYFTVHDIGSSDWLAWVARFSLTLFVACFTICVFLELLSLYIFKRHGFSLAVPGLFVSLLVVKYLQTFIQNEIVIYALLTSVTVAIAILFSRLQKFFTGFIVASWLLFLFNATVLHLGASQGNVDATTLKKIDSNSGNSVLLVIVDEVSFNAMTNKAGEIQEIYPTLKDFSEQSTNYTKAFASAGFTHLSVPAMLSGLPPTIDSSNRTLPEAITPLIPVNTISFDSKNLFKATSESERIPNETILEFDNRILVSNFVLPNVVLNQLKIPRINGKWSNFANIEATDNIEKFTTDKAEVFTPEYLNKSVSPELYSFYTSINHHPWVQDSEGKYTHSKAVPTLQGAYLFGFEDCDSCSDPISYVTEEKTLQAKRMYTNNLVWTDKVLGDLFSNIKVAGLWSEFTIIVTADHGNAFNAKENGRNPINIEELWSQLAHVPLMIKYPNQIDKVVIDEPTTNIRISSTIADALGLAKLSSDAAPRLCKSSACKEDADPLSKPIFFSGNSIESLSEKSFNESYLNSGFYDNRSHVASAINPDFPYALGDLERYAGQSEINLDNFVISNFKHTSMLSTQSPASDFEGFYIELQDFVCTANDQGLLVSDGIVQGTVQFNESRSKNRGGWTILPAKSVENGTLYCKSAL